MFNPEKHISNLYSLCEADLNQALATLPKNEWNGFWHRYYDLEVQDRVINEAEAQSVRSVIDLYFPETFNLQTYLTALAAGATPDKLRQQKKSAAKYMQYIVFNARKRGGITNEQADLILQHIEP